MVNKFKNVGKAWHGFEDHPKRAKPKESSKNYVKMLWSGAIISVLLIIICAFIVIGSSGQSKNIEQQSRQAKILGDESLILEGMQIF